MKNNLFNLMPTNRKEEISSAALVYILNSDDDYLKAEISKRLLGNGQPIPIVGAELEEPTYSEEGKGRLDIVVEAKDKFFYGIENKLTADFAPEQLKKYKSYLNDKYKTKHKLVTLLPKGHEKKSYAYENSDFICEWQDLLKVDLKGQNQTTEASIVFKELKEFVENIFRPFSSIDIQKIFNPQQDGSSFSWQHHAFLRDFISFYLSDELNNRLGSSQKGSEVQYCGAYFGQSIQGHEKELDQQKIEGYFCLESSKQGDGKLDLVILTTDQFTDLGLNFVIDKSERPETFEKAEKSNLKDDYICWRLSHEEAEKVKDWNEFGKKVRDYFLDKRNAKASEK